MTDATDCSIVQSAIYLTVNIGHEEEARAKALSMIHHQLERGSYEQDTILHTSYLGPDLEKLTTIDNGKDTVGTLNEDAGSSSSHPTSFYIAIGVVSLALLALVLFLAMVIRVRRGRKRVASASAIPSHRHSEIIVDDHIPYSSSSLPYVKHNSDRRSLLEHNDYRWESSM